jgi:hypothetical protein
VATPAGAQGGDDHTAAEALVKSIEGDAARRAVAGEAIEHARAALERATRLRSAGDEAHAKAADGLAREWAEDARDIVRAAEAEAAAAEVRRKAVDAQAQLERTRALVEEGIARVGRLKAELEEAARSTGAGNASKGRKAVEVHAGEPGPTAATKNKPPAGGKAASADKTSGQKATGDKAAGSKGAGDKATGGTP